MSSTSGSDDGGCPPTTATIRGEAAMLNQAGTRRRMTVSPQQQRDRGLSRQHRPPALDPKPAATMQQQQQRPAAVGGQPQREQVREAPTIKTGPGLEVAVLAVIAALLLGISANLNIAVGRAPTSASKTTGGAGYDTYAGWSVHLSPTEVCLDPRSNRLTSAAQKRSGGGGGGVLTEGGCSPVSESICASSTAATHLVWQCLVAGACIAGCVSLLGLLDIAGIVQWSSDGRHHHRRHRARGPESLLVGGTQREQQLRPRAPLVTIPRILSRSRRHLYCALSLAAVLVCVVALFRSFTTLHEQPCLGGGSVAIPGTGLILQCIALIVVLAMTAVPMAHRDRIDYAALAQDLEQMKRVVEDRSRQHQQQAQQQHPQPPQLAGSPLRSAHRNL